MALRCFIAMAFGREETDEVYDRLIAPILRKKDVTPVRVDRIEHIDDVDDRIISEIKACDFALADLTYARPSVYYEAGFAEREVPVIYTCRKDHLSPRADDLFGNFRVHFDLQMKNIIVWSSPSDRKFAERLAKRITRAITPLLKAKEAKRREKKEEEEFAALSLEQKTHRILRICVSRLRRAGFRGDWVDKGALSKRLRLPPHRDRSLEKLLDRALELEPGWLGVKSVDAVIHAALLHVTPSLTKSKLTRFRAGLLKYPVYDINPATETSTANQLLEHAFICSFRKVPISRVLDSLHDFPLDQQGKRFSWVGKQMVPEAMIAQQAQIYVEAGWYEFVVLNPGARHRDDRVREYRVRDNQLLAPGLQRIGQVKKVPRHIYIYVFDAIKSEKAFAKEFSLLLKTIKAEFG